MATLPFRYRNYPATEVLTRPKSVVSRILRRPTEDFIKHLRVFEPKAMFKKVSFEKQRSSALKFKSHQLIEANASKRL